MDNTIINRASLPREAAELFGEELLFLLESAPLGAPVEEIRVKRDKNVWVAGGGKNLMLDHVVGDGELREILLRACRGSIYSFAESIKNGFVPFCGGIRVGVCGVWSEGGAVKISSIAVRIPREIRLDLSSVRELLVGFGMKRGLLVFSPPLGGKTVFLRECARELASGKEALRVAVVDTREELGAFLSSPSLCIDLLSRYPKALGIEIAARTLGAQVVICDEIGYGETEAILELHGGGVPLIASAHASDLKDLLSRKGISALHKAGIFGGYVETTRLTDRPYRFYSAKEADAI